jgi:hypothetical protein
VRGRALPPALGVDFHGFFIERSAAESSEIPMGRKGCDATKEERETTEEKWKKKGEADQKAK